MMSGSAGTGQGHGPSIPPTTPNPAVLGPGPSYHRISMRTGGLAPAPVNKPVPQPPPPPKIGKLSSAQNVMKPNTRTSSRIAAISSRTSSGASAIPSTSTSAASISSTSAISAMAVARRSATKDPLLIDLVSDDDENDSDKEQDVKYGMSPLLTINSETIPFSEASKVYQQLDAFPLESFNEIKGDLLPISISESNNKLLMNTFCNVNAVVVGLAHSIKTCEAAEVNFHIHWNLLISKIQHEYNEISSTIKKENPSIGDICQGKLNTQILKLVNLAFTFSPKILEPISSPVDPPSQPTAETLPQPTNQPTQSNSSTEPTLTSLAIDDEDSDSMPPSTPNPAVPNQSTMIPNPVADSAQSTPSSNMTVISSSSSLASVSTPTPSSSTTPLSPAKRSVKRCRKQLPKQKQQEIEKPGKQRYKYNYDTKKHHKKNKIYDFTQPMKYESPKPEEAENSNNEDEDDAAKEVSELSKLWFCPVCYKGYTTIYKAKKHIKKGKHNLFGICKYPGCWEDRHNLDKFARHKKLHLFDDYQCGLLFQEDVKLWRDRRPDDRTPDQLLAEFIEKGEEEVAKKKEEANTSRKNITANTSTSKKPMKKKKYKKLAICSSSDSN